MTLAVLFARFEKIPEDKIYKEMLFSKTKKVKGRDFQIIGIRLVVNVGEKNEKTNFKRRPSRKEKRIDKNGWISLSLLFGRPC